jgi:hypothetical protein
MGTTPPYPPPPYQHQRGSAVSRAFLPLALITLGLVFLLGNLVPDRGRGGLIVLGLGAAFVIGRLTTGRYGYAVPAGILLAIGTYITLQQAQVFQGLRGPGTFFVLLGLGFGLVYVIGSRPQAVWPMFPAVILLCLGLVMLGVTSLAPLAAFTWIVAYWPAALVLIGLWLLFRDSLPQPVRRPLASLGVIALLGYGLLGAASTVAAGGAFVRTGFAPSFGPPPFTDSVVLEAPIASGQTLTVNNPSGKTTIHATNADTVHVAAARRYGLGGHAPEVRLNPTASGLSLDAAGLSGRFPFGSSSSVEYTIEVPSSVSVRAQSGSGDIELTDVAGEVRASTLSGQIRGTRLAHVREASSSSGSISLEGVFTDQANIRASSGTIDLKLLPGTAVQLNVRTGSGSVVPQGLLLSGGSTQQHSLTGAIGSPAPGAMLTVEASSGSVLISQ